MFYLITQFAPKDLERKEFAEQVSSLNDKMLNLGAKLLIHSDQWEFFVYRFAEENAAEIRKLCHAFARYAKEIAGAEFLFDAFTREEIEESGHFTEEFITALHAAERRISS